MRALTGVGWMGYDGSGCGCLGRSGGTVDAAVSKTVGSYIPCEFDSHLRHHVLGAMGGSAGCGWGRVRTSFRTRGESSIQLSSMRWYAPNVNVNSSKRSEFELSRSSCCS